MSTIASIIDFADAHPGWSMLAIVVALFIGGVIGGVITDAKRGN